MTVGDRLTIIRPEDYKYITFIHVCEIFLLQLHWLVINLA